MLKIGYKVRSLSNPAWSGPMIITQIYGDTVVCRHPTRGQGGFRFADIILYYESVISSVEITIKSGTTIMSVRADNLEEGMKALGWVRG